MLVIKTIKKFWGQEVEITNEYWRNHPIWKTKIRKPFWDGSIGLNEKLINEAIKNDVLLEIEVNGRGIFNILATEFKKKAKIIKKPSIIYPGSYFIIYLFNPYSKYGK